MSYQNLGRFWEIPTSPTFFSPQTILDKIFGKNFRHKKSPSPPCFNVGFEVSNFWEMTLPSCPITTSNFLGVIILTNIEMGGRGG